MEPLLGELSLTNFKAFGAKVQSAPMSKITLIYGPNSGGKSSIIQALLLLKQSGRDQPASSSIIPRGDFVDLAGFRSMVHKHDIEREIGINLSMNTRYLSFIGAVQVDMSFVDVEDLPTLNHVRYRMTHENTPPVDIRLVNTLQPGSSVDDNQAPVVRNFRWAESDVKSSIRSYIDFACRSAIRIDRYRRVDSGIEEDGGRVDVESIVPSDELLTNLNAATFQSGFYPHFLPLFIDIGGDNNVAKVNLTDGSKHEIEFVQHNFRVGLHEIAQSVMILTQEISYLGSLLDEPRRYYSGAIGDYASVGMRGEHTFDMLARSPTLQSRVNYWMSQFGIPYRLGILRDVSIADYAGAGAINIVTLVDERTQTTLTPADVGFGISQILPVIVEGLAGTSDIICVDQPEVHLHPKLQAEIAELMIATRDHEHNGCKIHRHDCCSDGSPCGAIAKQWIVETHSELLVRRIQSHIAEKNLTAEEVSVLYVNPTEEGSEIIKLEMDEGGEFIEDWPAGFFDESTAEILRMLRSQRAWQLDSISISRQLEMTSINCVTKKALLTKWLETKNWSRCRNFFSFGNVMAYFVREAFRCFNWPTK